MISRRSFHILMALMAIGAVGLARPSEGRAANVVVDAGYDLFVTVSSETSFTFPAPYGTQSLMGVPLGTFDFGGSIGTKSTGNADTIVQRPSAITVPSGGSGTGGLALLALQLESVASGPALAPGVPSGDHLFVWLDPTLPSTGTITINSYTAPVNPGTFTSTLDVYFDVGLGTTLAGAMKNVLSTGNETVLTSTPDSWSNVAPSGAELIKGVNYELNGTNNGNDFWPGPGLHNGPHGVNPAGSIPEPSAWVMGMTAAVMGLAYAGRRRRRT